MPTSRGFSTYERAGAGHHHRHGIAGGLGENYPVSTVRSDLEQQKAKFDEQQASLNELTTERNLRKLDKDLTFRIYDAVVTSLKASRGFGSAPCR